MNGREYLIKNNSIKSLFYLFIYLLLLHQLETKIIKKKKQKTKRYPRIPVNLFLCHSFIHKIYKK